MLITHSELKNLLHYDPETGIWTVANSNSPVSVSLHPAGYIQISIFGCNYLGHRLAWFFMTGVWPIVIDHKDGVENNNRWNNLRNCSQTQNIQNSKLRKDNSTGLKGVQIDRRRQGFRARIVVKSKQLCLGSFDCPAAAHFAYLVAADIHFGEFARAE